MFDAGEFRDFLMKRIKWFQRGGASTDFIKGMLAAFTCLDEFVRQRK